jgi:hypothetical protein
MEPQAPLTSQPEPSKKKLTKKQWILIAVGTVIIVIAAVVGLVVNQMHGTNNSSTQRDPNIYYSREGYSFEQTGKTIGDPLALDMSKHGAPLSSADGSNIPVVYACNILSINDLHEQKVYLEARQDAKAVTRGFLDRTGKAGVEINEYTLPGASTTDDNNACQYSLQSGGLLNIAVYQPPYTQVGAINDTLSRKYTKTDAVSGLDTYKQKDEKSSTTNFMVVSDKSAIEFLFNGTSLDTTAQKKLLATAARNFTEQEKTPVGAAIPQFTTPTYKQKYARACDFISNDDIKNLTGSDASVFTTEALPSATGVVSVDDKLYNSIATECSRYNTGLGSGLTAGAFDQKLDVTITSFNADTAAKKHMEASRKTDAGQVAASLGDEGYGFHDTADQNALVFRQGRFIVEIMFDRTVQRNAGLQDTTVMTQKLTPYAQQLATKLKSLQ